VSDIRDLPIIGQIDSLRLRVEKRDNSHVFCLDAGDLQSPEILVTAWEQESSEPDPKELGLRLLTVFMANEVQS